MLTIEGAQMKHLGVLNRLGPGQQASGIIFRQHVLGDGKMRMIPRHGHDLAGGLTVKARDLREFFRSFGGSVAMDFNVHAEAEPFRKFDESYGECGRLGGRRVVIESLNVNEMNSERSLRFEARARHR